ncbi:hypothetical protein FJN11_03740 [Streptococcus symci]|uniref:Uncharacterized protein n=1 Tax=Streptococcus symci TaxID=2588991 RepID=A0A501PEU4_9STRE|nr:hypothetical protein [uncultured Streptococcus sp.]MDU1404787.1 hypothetical protein [Streptococcus mitis]TPD58668.1 hypothetical protein FJN11_03740 [Streptococcus symci]
MSKFFAVFQNFDIIEVTKIKEIKYYERNHSSQLTAHSSQLTAHSSQLTAHADYVIGRVFCQALKQAFSHFCEKAFYVEFSELSLERNGELQYA